MKKILFALLLLPCVATGKAQDSGLSKDENGFYLVSTLQQFQDAVKNDLSGDGKKSSAMIKLTADLYLSELSERTFNNTFCGTIDGDGHTIWGASSDKVHDGGGHYKRTYLFTNAENATFTHLTFRNIRIQSDDNENQAVIVSNAKNSNFIGITIDNVSVWCDEDYVGSVAGNADHCCFKNVEVKNSDVTTDGQYAGGLVGYACNATTFENCTLDNKTAVYADGGAYFFPSYTGGIVGQADGCTILSCVSQALVGGASAKVGGMVGEAKDTKIESCVNAGLVVSAEENTNFPAIYVKYKNQNLPKRTLSYSGVTYTVMSIDSECKISNSDYMGGIVAEATHCQILSCVCLGDFITAGREVGGIVGSIDDSSMIDGCSNYGSNLLETGYWVGGIAGYSASTTINNCLNTRKVYSDAAYADGAGIVGYLVSDVAITNCLSTTKQPLAYYKAISAYQTTSGNNYVLAGAKTDQYSSAVTTEQLASGRVAYQLNGNTNDVSKSLSWQQNLGIDLAPVLGNLGVYYTRNVSNEYGTVCLPFPMKSNEDVAYYRFAGANNDNGDVALDFSYADIVFAGEPVLFCTSSKGELTFVGNGEGWSDYASNTANPYSDWFVAGTFEQKMFDETTTPSSNRIYYVSGGAIKNGKTVTINPFRAYFGGPSIDELTNNGSTPARVRIVIDGEENEAAALQLVTDDLVRSQNAKAYTLFGTEAGDGYRGIMVRGGKKVMR